MTTKIPAELSSTPGIADSSNATAITIGSNEKVGIGTTSTDHQLSVNAADFDGIQLLQGGTDTGYIGVYHDGSSTGRIYLGGLSSVDIQTGNGGATDGTTRVRVDSDGLKFGSDTAAANALDDYEEGNATLTFATSDTQYTTSGQSDSSTYTRIGNQVTLFVSISITSPTNGSGALRVTGLPFTNSGPQVTTSFCNLGRMGNSATQNPFGILPSSSDVITFYYNADGAVSSSYAASNLNGQVTPFINFTITYTV